jgi:hypothetical protein
MRRASLEDQARTDATRAANAAHAGKSDAERTADTNKANAVHAGKSDRDRSAETRAANNVGEVKNKSVAAAPMTSTPSSGNPATKGGSSWTKIESIVAGDDFYGCSRVFRAPEAGQKFEIVTPVQDWADGKNASGSSVAAEPKAFFVTAADEGGVNKVNITAGSINSIPNAGGLITVSNGQQIYLNATWDTGGFSVTDVVIGVGASVPANTSTESYTLLAIVAIVSGKTVVTNYAWNYSQAQACGSDGTGIRVNFW